MTLRIIGAGFGRTGTMSTYTALKELGLRCYHMAEVVQNPENSSHIDFWHDVASRPLRHHHNWEKVFAHYEAALDNPACCVWRELAEAYPNAKVLLTLHPGGAEAWYESTLKTIYFTETSKLFKVFQHVSPFARKFGEMSRKLIWERSLAGTMPFRSRAIAHYNRHIDEVTSSVPPERLLIFSVAQGWEPLCKFLDLPIPKTSFPNIKDHADFSSILRQAPDLLWRK